MTAELEVTASGVHLVVKKILRLLGGNDSAHTHGSPGVSDAEGGGDGEAGREQERKKGQHTVGSGRDLQGAGSGSWP